MFNNCGKCGKALVFSDVDGEFSRFTGKPIQARLCPDNHEGWKYSDTVVVELGYDEPEGWYEIRKMVANDGNGV